MVPAASSLRSSMIHRTLLLSVSDFQMHVQKPTSVRHITVFTGEAARAQLPHTACIFTVNHPQHLSCHGPMVVRRTKAVLCYSPLWREYTELGKGNPCDLRFGVKYAVDGRIALFFIGSQSYEFLQCVLVRNISR